MDLNALDTPTVTLTPTGVFDVNNTCLAPVSTSDLQVLERTLEHYSGSKNELINASTDLLALCGTITRMVPGGEMNTIRSEMSRAIIDLKYRVVRMDYPPSVAENLCLLFAIFLDEFILVSPWGRESGWENRTLVADLFGFRDGGNRFYHIAERALMQPRALSEFIEIIYIFLKLGFRGKFDRSNDHDRDRLIDRLEAALKLFEGKSKPEFAGRAIKDTFAQRRIFPTRYKIGMATISIVLISIIAWGLNEQMKDALQSEFQQKSKDAEGGNAMDYIFSSETGKVTSRSRK